MTIFRDEPLIELTMSEEVAASLVRLLNKHKEDAGYADIARSLQTVLDGEKDQSGVADEYVVQTP
jgi:hypothetical protein